MIHYLEHQNNYLLLRNIGCVNFNLVKFSFWKGRKQAEVAYFPV